MTRPLRSMPSPLAMPPSSGLARARSDIDSPPPPAPPAAPPCPHHDGDPPMHPVPSHHSVACRDTSRRGFGRRLACTLGALAVAGGALAIVVPAFANDLSTNPCTAQDVEIVGNGFVTNEPCSCTPGATFDAVVQF